MVIKLDERPVISVGDTELVSINYTAHLDGSELVTGTPTVAEQATTDLTLSDKSVNSATYTEAYTGDTVAIGKAVQFSVLGGNAANSPYTIRVTTSTDGSPVRTFVRDLEVSFA